MRPTALFDLLAHAERPDHVALVTPARSWTYRGLEEAARRVAGALDAAGVRAGDRVALLSTDPETAVLGFWGVVAAGAVAVDIPAHAGSHRAVQALAESRPAAVIGDLGLIGRVPPEHRPPASLVARDGEAPDGTSPWMAEPVPAAEVDAAATAVVMYTSGTSGDPKGVMLSHDNLLSNVAASAARAPIRADERLLLVVPPHFIHGRMQLVAHAHASATVVLSEGFQFPPRVVDELRRHQITSLSGVPYHFHTLLHRSRLADTDLPHFRRILVTGGRPEIELLRRLRRALPRVALTTAYGATEASPRITYMDDDELKARPSSAGRALPGVKIEILATDGGPVPRGALGEVAISGPGVMQGYLSGDHARGGVIDAQGRLRTGDLGKIDADGYLYLAGRRSELIKTAGERVFPREIEVVLDRHPAVQESAVVGVPDPALGERLVALVVPAEGAALDPGEVRRYALRWMPFVRAPREVYAVGSLPKTSHGKVHRPTLTAMVDGARRRHRPYEGA